LNNLGRLLRETKRQQEAEKVYLRALETFEKNPNDHRGSSQMATTYANLGHCYADLGKFLEAEKAFRKALELDQNIYGSRHIETATDMSNLGMFLMNRGRYLDAEPLLRSSLKIFESQVGKSNKLYVGTFHCLEGLKQRQLWAKMNFKKK